MKLDPLGDNVILAPSEPEGQTRGGLLLPDRAKDKPQMGEVLAIGPGKWHPETQTYIPHGIQVGDVVIHYKAAGTEYTDGGRKLKIVHAGDVLAKVVK